MMRPQDAFTVLPLATSGANIACGAGMLAVVALSVLYFRRKYSAGWRWLWVGAAVWTVGVGLKFAFSIPLNKPILHGLKQAVPPWAFLPIAAVYIGLLTGIFEIGVTLIAGLKWRSLAAEPSRAVAVGAGAGAFEALLLALLAFGVGGAWFIGPVERIIAILCHTSSRTLTLFTVATGRWRYFWVGFALMTAIDGVAGYFLLSGLVQSLSGWWIELAIAPFAVVSVPLIRWCIRSWTARTPLEDPAVAAPPAVFSTVPPETPAAMVH